MTTVRGHVMLVALAVVAAGCHGSSVRPLVLRGGAIYTLDTGRPWASALVIDDGRIVYVGDDAGTRSYLLEGARVIELGGRMVLPGFHDAHLHPMSGAMRLFQCALDAGSVEALYAAVRACASAKPRRAWVFGNGIPQAIIDGGLTCVKLDELVPDRPAFLRTDDGFTSWANSRALRLAGIDPEGTGPQTPGVDRDPTTRRPTGILRGEATSLVRRLVPEPTEAEHREALRRATGIANRYGITSVFDASAPGPLLDAYRAASVNGELTVRVVVAQRIDATRGEEQVDDLIARRDRVRGRRLRADAAKLFLDGEIEMHTAALLAPYADAPGSSGHLLIPPAALDALARRLDAAGFLIHMHAMGDGAVRAGLDAIDRAIRANGVKDRRHQLAHIGVADPADIPRFGRLGIAANFSPIWFHVDDPAAAPSMAVLGPERSRWMFPIASIAARGGRIVASSDWPGPSMNPLVGIQSAITREPLDGSKPPLQPEERVSLAAILAAYTKDAAWAVREDAIDGSIATGKAADLVVLDQNLFRVDVRAIHEVRVLLTLLDGEPVYRDPQLAWP
jgi:predicted amidohydrolase YtcJ